MKRKIYDSEGHAHFVTFSCYRKRKHLDHNRAKGIVVHYLSRILFLKKGHCLGYVVMPEHVHALVWFSASDELSVFMQQWKRCSSFQLKKFFEKSEYFDKIYEGQPVWQARYYDFNTFSEKKVHEKINYMHMNPVRRGLVENPCDWKFSSARWYGRKESVGVKIGLPV